MHNPAGSSPEGNSSDSGVATVAPDVLEKLARLDCCTASNAIEALGGRLRNEGFTDVSIRCQFPGLPPVTGYAVTGRIRSSEPPIAGGWYYDHMDWWRYVLSIPEPRIIVMQCTDEQERRAGAWFGEIHAAISRAIGCTAYLTNGSVRDLDAVKKLGIQLFASGVVVSHAYAHVVEFGAPVEVGGLKVHPGDLLHGDRHGVHLVPAQVAANVPRVADELREGEARFLEYCASAEFSVENMGARLRDLRAQLSLD